MDDVGALEDELDAFADRQPDFVGGENRSAAIRRVVGDAPPELLASDLDPERCGLAGLGKGPQRRHQPERIGEQQEKQQRGYGRAAPEDQPAGSLLADDRAAPAGRVEEQTDDR